MSKITQLQNHTTTKPHYRIAVFPRNHICAFKLKLHNYTIIHQTLKPHLVLRSEARHITASDDQRSCSYRLCSPPRPQESAIYKHRAGVDLILDAPPLNFEGKIVLLELFEDDDRRLLAEAKRFERARKGRGAPLAPEALAS